MSGYDDFQDSEDLFEQAPNMSTRPSSSSTSTHEPRPHGPAADSDTLSKILKELEDIKRIILEQSSRQQTRSQVNVTGFVVERSPVDKPLTEYLKKRFVVYPFLKGTDEELKRKINKVMQEIPLASQSALTIKTACIRFSLRKMTEFRNQTKAKLLNPSTQTAAMSLRQLQNHLFRKFNGSEEESKRLTTCLRCYCHEKKLFSKTTTEENLDFWKGFQEFMELLESNTDPGKWTKLAERECNRIERYLNAM